MRAIRLVLALWSMSCITLMADCPEASIAYQHLLMFDYCTSLENLEEGSLSYQIIELRCWAGYNSEPRPSPLVAEDDCDSTLILLIQGYDSLYYNRDSRGALLHFMHAYDRSRTLGGDLHKLVLLSLQEFFGRLLYTDHQNYDQYLTEYRSLDLSDVEKAWALHYEAQHWIKNTSLSALDSLKNISQRFQQQLQHIDAGSKLHVLGKSSRALLYEHDGNLEKALALQLEILAACKSTPNIRFLAVRATQRIIFIRTQQEQYQEALEYTDELEQYATLRDSNRILFAVHRRKAVIYDKLNQPQAAYRHLNRALLYQVYTNYQEIGKYSAAQEAQLRTLQNEKDLLQADIKLQAGRRLRLRMLALLGFLGLATMVILYRLRINNLEKRQYVVALENEQKDSQLRAINARMDGEEAQRFKIAGYLHDHVAGSLAALKVHLDVSERQSSASLEKPRNLAHEVGADIRRLSHELFPSILLHRTLADALRQLCEKYSTCELRINFIDQGEAIRFDRNTRVKLYFVVKELLTNVIKHSGAADALVKLSAQGDQVILQVRDDGQGFSPDQHKR